MLGTSKREDWKPYQLEQPRLRGGRLPPEPLGPGSLQSFKSRNGCLTACGCYLTATHSRPQGKKSVKNSSRLLQGRASHIFRGHAEGRGSWEQNFSSCHTGKGQELSPPFRGLPFLVPVCRMVRISGTLDGADYARSLSLEDLWMTLGEKGRGDQGLKL